MLTPTFLNNFSSTTLLLLSVIISVGIGLIAIFVIRSKRGTLENLIYWYLILAGGVLILAALTCQGTVPLVPRFYLCIKTSAPGLTLLAAHIFILILYIDHRDSEKLSLSGKASLAARGLILLTAYLFILPEQHLVFPAIAGITLPLMITVNKYSKEKHTDEKTDAENQVE